MWEMRRAAVSGYEPDGETQEDAELTDSDGELRDSEAEPLDD